MADTIQVEIAVALKAVNLLSGYRLHLQKVGLDFMADDAQRIADYLTELLNKEK